MAVKIPIKTEFIKLDQLLKLAGAAETGGHAKEMIQDGEILVDGVVCLQRGRKMRPGMAASVQGEDYEVVASED